MRSGRNSETICDILGMRSEEARFAQITIIKQGSAGAFQILSSPVIHHRPDLFKTLYEKKHMRAIEAILRN